MSVVVTFDAGMTLVELDLSFLTRRLAERGVAVEEAALHVGAPAAWRRYDERADAGLHDRLWHELLADHLRGAIDPSEGPTRIEAEVDWLWSQQPTRNLFRAPISDMVALARDLRGRGVRTAVLSNSEGRLAELLAEIGIADAFEVIVDSGRVGIEKPDPRIFELVLAELGAKGPAIHIGDSWSADIAGALAAGWRAIWYGRRAIAVEDPRVAIAKNAAEAAAALIRFGV
jgi:putative hydrolase of the HAD superfamily